MLYFKKKRKRIKKGDMVICMSDIPLFTIGKVYKVLGNAPKFNLIIKNDSGSRSVPHNSFFKKITLWMRIRKLLKGKYLNI